MQINEMFGGLQVIELASVLAGPSVGQFFAELGAEVIKIENLKTHGDITRTWKGKNEPDGDISAYFSSVNWGKKSIAVDLSLPAGQEVMQALASRADMVIASFKPGDATKLGVDFQTLILLNPGLIYGQITGYGSENERVGYDAIIQAEAGFMDMNGELGGSPLKMPVALVDVLAAHHLKEALLLAMLRRQKTGKGDLVEVSLIQAAVASLANQAANWLVAKSLPIRQGSSHPNIAPYGDHFVAKDGKSVLLAIGSDLQFQKLCTLLNRDELAFDSRFESNAARVKNREELYALIQLSISQVDSREFISQCNSLKIPVGAIQNMKEVFEMDEARQLLMHSGAIAGVRGYVGHSMGALPKLSHILPPPAFGQHTHEILGEKLSFSTEKLAMLHKIGAIN